ncbi:MAG: hypothetical protein HXX14_10935 [Bacteroidetes bacterium]|nr:hypothetical protein [Bacteroidota bacterium]
MFRKLIHLVITFTILLATSGITVTKHYCGDKLESIAVNTIHKSCCGDNCPFCHNVTRTFKVKDNFFVSDFKINTPKIINLDWLSLPINTDLSFVSNPFVKKQIFSPLILPFESGPTPAFLQEFRC